MKKLGPALGGAVAIGTGMVLMVYGIEKASRALRRIADREDDDEAREELAREVERRRIVAADPIAHPPAETDWMPRAGHERIGRDADQA